MKTRDFKKLSIREQEETYGGWAWLATAAPLFLQAVMTAITSYKLLTTDKGGVKYKGMDTKWEEQKEKHSSSSSSRSHYVYAF